MSSSGTKRTKKYPIKHWSYSSLMSFLRNPLAWHKRYVDGVYDLPSGPAGIIGRAGHKALEYFYNGVGKEESVQLGLNYIRNIPDFEINFGKAVSRAAQKKKRLDIEKIYLQAIGFYLKRAPRHKVLGVEFMGMAKIDGLPLPVKAISDLVIESHFEKGAIDIVDHKFIESFSKDGSSKPLFILQAIFNYYTVREEYGVAPKRFILQECKKRRNKDGSSQMKRHIITYEEHEEDFDLFHRLLLDASNEIVRRRIYLPNPSDMFEGDDSFEIYRMSLVDEP